MRKSFKKGQKIICKDTDDYRFGTPRGLEIGKIYTVDRVERCAGCGCEVVLLKEAKPMRKWCGFCDTETYDTSYHNIRFAPYYGCGSSADIDTLQTDKYTRLMNILP